MADMDISRQTKKMLLFVSPDNSFWSIIFKKREISQRQISDYMDVSHGTIPGWKNGGHVGLADADLSFKTIRRRLAKPLRTDPELSAEDARSAVETLDAFIQDFYNDHVSIYATAAHIGMTISQSQKIIDEVIYKRGPIFPRMYSANAGPATSVFHHYQGVYMLWVRRRVGNSEGARIWLQAPLRVRYVLQIGAGFLVRCKLNAPMIEPEAKTYWEYDGFLVKKPNKIFWLFEKRDRDKNDQFHFITGAGRPYRSPFGDRGKLRTMSGKYLTTEQDEYQTIADGRVILQRVAQNGSTAPDASTEVVNEQIRTEETHMMRIMHSSALVIDDEEKCRKLDLFLDNFDQTPQ
jgi:hypothetical protein